MYDLIHEEEIALSLVILSWNTCDITLACIDSILANPPHVPWELIVVDNASTDESPRFLKERYGSVPHIRIVLNSENNGFTGGNNQAIEMSLGKVIGLLNSDTLVPEGALTELYRYLVETRGVGVVGPTLTHDDGSPTTSYGYFPTPWTIFTSAFLPGWMWGDNRKALGVVPDSSITEPIEVGYISGATFFVKRDVIDKVGAFDAETFFAYFEEVDWCLRIKKAGWKMIFMPNVKIVHLEGKSFEKLNVHRRILQYDSAKKYYRKHYSLPLLWWYMFCQVFGSLVKVMYFGIRIMLQPGRKDRWLHHYHWNTTVFEIWRRGFSWKKEPDA